MRCGCRRDLPRPAIPLLPSAMLCTTPNRLHEAQCAPRPDAGPRARRRARPSFSCRASATPHARLICTIAAVPRAAPPRPDVLPPATALAFVAVSLSGALAACLLAAIPTLLSLKRAADELALLAATVRSEVPDTAAAVRLSGLELSDAFEEVGGLTAGVFAHTRETDVSRSDTFPTSFLS